MSRARYVDPTIPRGNDHFESATDNLGLTDAISFIHTVPFLSFGDSLGLTDTVTLLGDDPGGTELVGIAEGTAIRRILAFVDDLDIVELFTNNDVPPTIGMSRPFTYDIGWRDIINKVTSTIEQRYSYPQEVVWQTDTTQNIFPGEELVIHARSDNPFYDAVIPVPGVKSYSSSDQLINPDIFDFFIERGTVSVSLSRTSGQSLDITVRALNNQLATITGMSLRAIPVKVAHQHTVKDADINSQNLNGIKTPSDEEEISTWANRNDSKAIMEVILNQRFKRLPVLEFSVKNGNAQRLRAMLDLRLSDRVHVRETETFTDNDFFVETISHSIDQAGTYHESVIGCEQIPVPVPGAAIFNDASLGFNIGVFGDRANRYNFDDNLFIVGESNLDGNKVIGL